MLSWDCFDGLRSTLIYLRSISVIFETGKAGGHLAAIEEEVKLVAPETLTEEDLSQLSFYCSQSAMYLHAALLYTAVCFYESLLEVNPALAYDKLDRELEKIRRSGLLDSMCELRNAVFHVRPNVRSHHLLRDFVRCSAECNLEWNTLENLLFDATEKVFRSPEVLFQEKREVLEEGFRKALAYYEEHVADNNE